MYDELFSDRLASLRINKGVSARDMSLNLGQNPGYINNIETGKALPSMSMFFYICEFLGITPEEFFDFKNTHPETIKNIISNIKELNSEQLDTVLKVIECFRKYPYQK